MNTTVECFMVGCALGYAIFLLWWALKGREEAQEEPVKRNPRAFYDFDREA